MDDHTAAFVVGVAVGLLIALLWVYAPPSVLFAVGCVVCVIIAGTALWLLKDTRV